MKTNTITLAMIVRDEADVIERCLDSVATYVDNILIHDTGSTDRTKEIVEAYIKKNALHGFVESVEWKDFGFNRSLVLTRARNTADYTLMLDADEILKPGTTFLKELQSLTADIYAMDVKLGDIEFTRNFLFKNTREWKFCDPVHEYAACDGAFKVGKIANASIKSTYEGARSKDADKYVKDAETLVRYDEEHGTTPRRTFYTAQCYKDAGRLEEAVKYYKKRIDMESGWWQERYFSFYMLGRLTKDPKALLEAYLLEPLRTEPLLVLGKLLMDQQNWNAAHMFLLAAIRLTKPPVDSLFVESDVYAWRAELEFAVCMYYMGNYREASNINQRLLDMGRLPSNERALVERNLKFCEEKLK